VQFAQKAPFNFKQTIINQKNLNPNLNPRDIVRTSVNAGEHDNVLFVSSGCTGAVHRLLSCLGLPAPPVVFLSPYEHHSNLLPWREAGAEMVHVDESRDGRQLDLAHLELKLREYSTNPRFFAASFFLLFLLLTRLRDVQLLVIKYETCHHDYNYIIMIMQLIGKFFLLVNLYRACSN